MIGVSKRKLHNNNWADEEIFYQCPYCGADHWFQKNAPKLCSICGKLIDTLIPLYTENHILMRITFHMGPVDPSCFKCFPYHEDNSKIRFK